MNLPDNTIISQGDESIMLDHIFEVICVAIEVWMVFLYLSHNSRNRVSTFHLLIGIVLFGSGLTVLSFIDNIPLVRLVYTFSGISLLGGFLYSLRPKQCVLHSLFFCILIILADTLSSVLTSFAGFRTNLLTTGSAHTAYLLLDHVILLIGLLFLLLFQSHTNMHYSLKEFILLLPGIFVTILLCFLLLFQYTAHGLEIPYAYLCVILGLFLIDILFLYFIHYIQIKEEQLKQQELSFHHYEMQQNYYNQLHKQQESVRALWHDLNKYLKAANIDQSESLKQLQDQIQTITKTIDTNNDVINIILNEYLTKMESLNIKFELDIRIPNSLPISTVDLYIILGNSLDNAIHACAFVTQEIRTIKLIMHKCNAVLFYELTNPFSDQQQPDTSGIHGYGISNIKRTVEKYHGNLSIKKEEGVFTLSSHINLPEK